MNETQTNEELTTYIVQELGKHHERREILWQVCERGGLNWKEAERLLILAEAQHKSSIAARKSPLLLFMSVGTLLLGVGLLAFNIQVLLAFFQKDVLGQILSLPGSYYRIIGLITGLGMTIGGVVGLWNALASVFPDAE